jgi:tape measure domain-containing protein
MSLEIEIKSNSKQAEDSLKRLLKTIDQMPTSVQKTTKEFSGFSKDVSNDLKTINKNVEQSGKSVERTVKSLGNFAKITGGLITGLLAAGGISSLSSQFTELNNRIALTTGRTQQLVVQQQKLFAISRRSNVDLQTTVDLYSSLVVNAQRSRSEATALTEVLIKAGKIGGGPAETIASSLVQLQQGLASGTLRGEELNSVLEGTPRIAQAIAKELKTTTGQLRALAAEGKISGDTVANALINAKDDIEKEFALLEIPFNQIIANSGRDIGVALNRVFKSVKGVLTSTFGDGDIVGGLTSAIVEGLSDLSVFFRGIQTDIVLFKLEFGSLQSIITRSWQGMVDGVVTYADKFIQAVNTVKDFAKSIGSIFYDLYIEVVGNSTWPDLVDGVISYAKKIKKAFGFIADFLFEVGKAFAFTLAMVGGLFAAFYIGMVAGFSAVVSIVFLKLGEGLSWIATKLNEISDFRAIELLASSFQSLNDVVSEIAIGMGLVSAAFATIQLGAFAGVVYAGVEIGETFEGMTDAVKGFSKSFEKSLMEKTLDGLDRVLDKVVAFSDGVKDAFYDIYDDVVGNSSWPDLVDGVNDYAALFNKAYDKVVSFADRVKSAFKELSITVRDSLVAPALGGLSSLMASLRNNIGRFINQVSGFAIEGITTALGVALTGAFSIAVLGGGFAGTLGTKIATAFIGAVGAYFLGFASNFNAGEAGENGVLNQIAMNTENVVLTIQDGIGQLLGVLATASGAIGGSSAVTGIDVLTPLLRLFSENVAGFVLAIPLFIGAVKALGGLGNSIVNLLQGSAIRSVGSAAGDAGQVAASRGQISRLRATEDRLKADIESIGATFKGGAAELEVEKDRLTESLRQTSESIKQQESVLTDARKRRNERRDSIIRGTGNVAGAAGGLLGGFAGAALGSEIGRAFGLTSGQTLIATLLGSQIIGILGAGLAQFFVQRAVAGLFLASGAIKTAMITAGTVVATILRKTFVIGGAILRGAISLGATIGAALFRGALVAGALLAQAALVAGAFIVANAIPIAIGLGIAALLAAIYIFKDKIIEGGEWLLEKITEGFDAVKEKGKEFADAVMDGFGKIKDLGKDMATSFLEKLKGLNPFGGGDEPVRRATGGSVFGAGTATSDSIPAMLSNGEFVVKTSVADKHRGFLQSLNSTGKLPKFATGGTVGGDGPGIMSELGDAGAGILDTIMAFMEKIFGKDLISTMGEIFANLKKSLGFGGGSKASDPAQILSPTDLANSIVKALPKQSLNTDDLVKAFGANARLTERVISLNEQRNKVQQAIADIEAKNEPVPLQLSNQLRLIDSDIITETGKVADILDEIKEDGKLQIKAIDALATNATNDFKGDVQGGLTGLLKGEIGLGEFGEGLLTDFTGGVLETLAGGITEGIFNTEDGEASGIGGGIESLFKAIGMDGFALGSAGGEKVEELVGTLGSTEGTPMYVRVVNALGLGGGEEGEGGLFGKDKDAVMPEEGEAKVGGVEGEGPVSAIPEEGQEGLKGIFTKFTGSFSGILDGFLPGLGGMFDGLLGGLSGAFEGLMGMFGGGGGGGGLGGLLGMFGGFFNDGGLVPGGGPTPVIAHGGEMILNKRQQSNLFGQLQSGQNQGAQQTTQNIHITGDISRQTKKEIFGMLPQIATGVNQQNREQNR